MKEQQDKVHKAKAMLQRVQKRQWNKKNKHRVPASYQEGDWVLVHHSRLPAWPHCTSDNPYFGPTRSCLWMVIASLCGVLRDQGGPWCAQLNRRGATTTHRTSLVKNGN